VHIHWIYMYIQCTYTVHTMHIHVHTMYMRGT
jgi:hypothetical protein